MKRWLLTLLVYIISLAVIATVAFFLALFLVGPHGGILPDALHLPTGILLWICVIAIPLWTGYRTYKKCHQGKTQG